MRAESGELRFEWLTALQAAARHLVEAATQHFPQQPQRVVQIAIRIGQQHGEKRSHLVIESRSRGTSPDHVGDGQWDSANVTTPVPASSRPSTAVSIVSPAFEQQ